MNTFDVILAYMILVIFFIIYSFNYIIVGKVTIARNWSKHECDPSIIPFSSIICDKNSECAWQDIEGKYAPSHIKPEVDSSGDVVYGTGDPEKFNIYKSNRQDLPPIVQMEKCMTAGNNAQINMLMQPMDSQLAGIGQIGNGISGRITGLQNMMSGMTSTLTDGMKGVLGGMNNVQAASEETNQNIQQAQQQSAAAVNLLSSVGAAGTETVKAAWNEYPRNFLGSASIP